jgi:S1-C subfamily serine protease
VRRLLRHRSRRALRARQAPAATSRLKLGDSNAVEIGESVVALGHPLGSQTLKLTEGVISGRDAGLLSTTSPLNPGNSGGPLVNKHGDVVGVNVAIIENSQNIGFAIPSFQLGLLFDSLASRPADAKVLFKPVLGCAIINTSPALLAYSGITDDGGDGRVHHRGARRLPDAQRRPARGRHHGVV